MHFVLPLSVQLKNIFDINMCHSWESTVIHYRPLIHVHAFSHTVSLINVSYVVQNCLICKKIFFVIYQNKNLIILLISENKSFLLISWKWGYLSLKQILILDKLICFCTKETYVILLKMFLFLYKKC